MNINELNKKSLGHLGHIGHERWDRVTQEVVKKNCRNEKKDVDSSAVSCNTTYDMSEIRDAILEQMRKSGLTIYRVAKLVEGKVPRRTVYAFLTGEQDASTEKASIIMKAVGLKVTPTRLIAKRRKGR